MMYVCSIYDWHIIYACLMKRLALAYTVCCSCTYDACMTKCVIYVLYMLGSKHKWHRSKVSYIVYRTNMHPRNAYMHSFYAYINDARIYDKLLLFHICKQRNKYIYKYMLPTKIKAPLFKTSQFLEK